MITLIRAIIFLIVVSVTTYFAVSNTAEVDVTWSPIHDPISMPVFVLALGGLAVGFLLGGFLVWFNNLSVIIDRRKKNKEIRKLEKKLEQQEKNLEDKVDTDAVLITTENQP